MIVNNRFAVAIQVLALARCGHGSSCGCPVTSEQMAEFVNTNPVVIRRILGPLREAGLVTSQPGPGGGWRLSRPPAEISLQDVYLAVDADRAEGSTESGTAAGWAAGGCLGGVLRSCYQAAQVTLEAKLAQVTMADVIQAFEAHRTESAACGSIPYAKEQIALLK
jgi:Rrf2 family protein